MESERRFRAAFTALIDVFVREDGPLIFFLDDIQWIDPASLELSNVFGAGCRRVYALHRSLPLKHRLGVRYLPSLKT